MGLWEVLLLGERFNTYEKEQQRLEGVVEQKFFRGMTDQHTQTMEAPSPLFCKGCITSQGLLLTDEETRI